MIHIYKEELITWNIAALWNTKGCVLSFCDHFCHPHRLQDKMTFCQYWSVWIKTSTVISRQEIAYFTWIGKSTPMQKYTVKCITCYQWSQKNKLCYLVSWSTLFWCVFGILSHYLWIILTENRKPLLVSKYSRKKCLTSKEVTKQ